VEIYHDKLNSENHTNKAFEMLKIEDIWELRKVKI
jgi:hypothetical protein